MDSICIFCGSSDSVHADYLAGARLMGATLARRGIRLIYGGGKTGLMGAVADGALEAGGEVIGVIIPSMNTAPLAHAGITSMEVTSTMHARKARHARALRRVYCPAWRVWHLRRAVRGHYLGTDGRARKTDRPVESPQLLCPSARRH